MSDILQWGCCPLKLADNRFIQCDVCKKAFHLLCLENDEIESPWICISCTADAEDKVTKRPLKLQKRQAENSPTFDDSIHEHGNQGNSGATRDEVRSIMKELFDAQRQSLVSEIVATMKSILNPEFVSIKEDLQEVKKSQAFLNNMYEDLSKNYQSSKETIKKLEKQNDALQSTVSDLQQRVNQLEQNARSNNIEIQCVPERKTENLIDIVAQIGNVIGCAIKEENITYCTRTAKTNRDSSRPRSIVVQLNTSRTRDQVLAAAIKFNKAKNTEDKLNSSHLGFIGKKTPIFITEHLSPTNKALHATARRVLKEKGYKYIWSRNGKIFARKNDDSDYKIIKDYDTINKLE